MKTISICFGSLLLAVAGYLFWLTVLFDPSVAIKDVAAALEQQWGLEVKTGYIAFKLGWPSRIEIDGVIVRDGVTQERYLASERLTFEIPLWGLLWRSWTLQRLQLTHPVLSLPQTGRFTPQALILGLLDPLKSPGGELLPGKSRDKGRAYAWALSEIRLEEGTLFWQPHLSDSETAGPVEIGQWDGMIRVDSQQHVLYLETQGVWQRSSHRRGQTPKMEPPGQARSTLKTRLRPLGSGEVRPTQKRHLAEAEDTFILDQGRGLLRRRIDFTASGIWHLKEDSLELKAHWDQDQTEITGTIKPFTREPVFEGTIQMRQVNLATAWFRPWLPIQDMEGRLTLHLKARMAVWPVNKMIETLDLSGAVAVRDGVWTGRNLVHDLLQTLEPMPEVSVLFLEEMPSETAQILRASGTQFEVMNFNLEAHGENFKLTDLVLNDENYWITGDAAFKLRSGDLNSNARLVLRESVSGFLAERVGDLAALRNPKGRLVLPFQYAGLRGEPGALKLDLKVLVSTSVEKN